MMKMPVFLVHVLHSTLEIVVLIQIFCAIEMFPEGREKSIYLLFTRRRPAFILFSGSSISNRSKDGASELSDR